MLFKLILLLTVIPLVELYLLVKLTQWTDSFAVTVGIIIVTGVVGAFLARLQGLRVVERLRDELRRGKLPPGSIMDGVMILVAAALLVTPGLLTDAFGFFLLTPFGRALLKRVLKKLLQNKLEDGSIRFQSSRWHPPRSHEPYPGSEHLPEDDAGDDQDG